MKTKTKKQIKEEKFQAQVMYAVRRQEQEDMQYWKSVSEDPNWRMTVLAGKDSGTYDNKGRKVS